MNDKEASDSDCDSDRDPERETLDRPLRGRRKQRLPGVIDYCWRRAGVVIREMSSREECAFSSPTITV